MFDNDDSSSFDISTFAACYATSCEESFLGNDHKKTFPKADKVYQNGQSIKLISSDKSISKPKDSVNYKDSFLTENSNLSKKITLNAVKSTNSPIGPTRLSLDEKREHASFPGEGTSLKNGENLRFGENSSPTPIVSSFESTQKAKKFHSALSNRQQSVLTTNSPLRQIPNEVSATVFPKDTKSSLYGKSSFNSLPPDAEPSRKVPKAPPCMGNSIDKSISLIGSAPSTIDESGYEMQKLPYMSNPLRHYWGHYVALQSIPLNREQSEMTVGGWDEIREEVNQNNEQDLKQQHREQNEHVSQIYHFPKTLRVENPESIQTAAKPTTISARGPRRVIMNSIDNLPLKWKSHFSGFDVKCQLKKVFRHLHLLATVPKLIAYDIRDLDLNSKYFQNKVAYSRRNDSSKPFRRSTIQKAGVEFKNENTNYGGGGIRRVTTENLNTSNRNKEVLSESNEKYSESEIRNVNNPKPQSGSYTNSQPVVATLGNDLPENLNLEILNGKENLSLTSDEISRKLQQKNFKPDSKRGKISQPTASSKFDL